MTDKIEALERLAKLAEDGRITEDEYGTLKHELLNGDQTCDAIADSEWITQSLDTEPLRPGWYPDEKPGLEHYWDGQKWTGSTRPVQHAEEESEPGLDMYEIALAAGNEPDDVGWFPDPEQLGTHMRFFNGSEWTKSVRERRAPGWYPVVETSGQGPYSRHRERYFNGLEFTHEYRAGQSRGSKPVLGIDTPLAWRDIKERRKDWRFWVGLFLVALGCLAVVASLYRFSNERVQTLAVLMLNVVLDPYIWGGVGGLALLRRWKKNTDPPQETARPSHSNRDLMK